MYIDGTWSIFNLADRAKLYKKHGLGIEGRIDTTHLQKLETNCYSKSTSTQVRQSILLILNDGTGEIHFCFSTSLYASIKEQLITLCNDYVFTFLPEIVFSLGFSKIFCVYLFFRLFRSSDFKLCDFYLFDIIWS